MTHYDDAPDTCDGECARLGLQHRLWAGAAHAVRKPAGIGPVGADTERST